MRCFLLILCFIFSFSNVAAEPHKTRTVVCEFEILRLKCEYNKVIHIVEGNYGRTNSFECKHGYASHHSSNCRLGKALPILQELCQGKTECAVHVSNSVFGDPCPRTFKYVSVVHQCVDPEEFKYAIACEDEVLQLECSSSTIIEVVEANYGRFTTAGYCSKSARTTDCSSSKSTRVVSLACNGRRECALLACNGLFGDPCRGTLKYLTVNYHCIPDPELPKNTKFEMSKYVCENETLHLDCSTNKMIKVLDASYGKFSAKICPQEFVTRDIKCKFENSTQIVQSSCNGKQHCYVEASNDVFGDPCLAINKYLQVQYVCESNKLQIEAS